MEETTFEIRPGVEMRVLVDHGMLRVRAVATNGEEIIFITPDCGNQVRLDTHRREENQVG